MPAVQYTTILIVPPTGTHLRDRVHDFQHMRGKGVDKKEKPYESEW
jgi:hypothetical protein